MATRFRPHYLAWQLRFRFLPTLNVRKDPSLTCLPLRTSLDEEDLLAPETLNLHGKRDQTLTRLEASLLRSSCADAEEPLEERLETVEHLLLFLAVATVP